MAAKKSQKGKHGLTAAQNRSDLALELIRGADKKGAVFGSVKKTEVIVDDKLSAKLKRPVGRYVTVESDAPLSANRACYGEIIDELANCLRSMTVGCESFLAVGIGNPLLTADALGARAVTLLKVNRFCSRRRGKEKELSAFAPSVSGVTGIESRDMVASVTELVKPDCVIMIDSLASATVSRLGTAFQICDSGLTPGSGVGSGTAPLCADTLNVERAISIGVPLVVYADTIIRDALGGENAHIDESVARMVVTPKDIDMIMGECAHIIAESINTALNL